MTFPCPKCGRTLEQTGEATVTTEAGRAVVYPVFQCDECIAVVEMEGERMELALTFAVDENGQAFDPASPDGKLPI